MKNLLLTLALIVILFSCENQAVNESLTDVEPSNEKAIPATNTGIENAPMQSGFIVTREDATLIFVIVDFDKQITITVGVDNYDFCNPFPNFDAFKTVPSQMVNIPNDPLRTQIVQKGIAYFEIIQGTILPDEFICDFTQNNELIASGYAKTTSTDNDLTIYLRDNPKNHNAFGISAKGVLQDQLGNDLNFKLNYKFLWDGINDESIREVINISLK